MELAEQAFATELQRLTAHLAERLTGLHDGQPKVFRDSAVENLREFFERLGRLNIRSSPELDAHVEQAELTINGIEAWRGGRFRMTSEMELVVAADGVARCIYGEELDLREIGRLSITRASHVEPDAEGYWWADMGPYGSRSEALGAEREWLARRRIATETTNTPSPASTTPVGSGTAATSSLSVFPLCDTEARPAKAPVMLNCEGEKPLMPPVAVKKGSVYDDADE